MEYQMKDVLDELRNIIQEKSSNIWMDIKEACRYACIGDSTLRRAVRKGELKVSKRTGKLLFKREWVDRWLGN